MKKATVENINRLLAATEEHVIDLNAGARFSRRQAEEEGAKATANALGSLQALLERVQDLITDNPALQNLDDLITE